MTKTARHRKRVAAKAPADLDAVRDRVAAVRKLAPQTIDLDAVRVLVGAVKVRTLADVASIFGVARNTCQTSWRQAGCPGSHGAWDVTPITCWLLQRERDRADAGRPLNPYGNGRDELREIELAQAKANLRIRQARAAVVEGDLIPRHEVEAGLVQFVAVCRDTLLNIPRELLPSLPVKQAEAIAANVDQKIRRVLVMLSEASPADFTGDGHRANGEPREATG